MAIITVNYTCNVNTKISNLNVRNQPSMNGKIIGSLAHGQKNVKVSKISGDWYYVTNKKGWSHSSYLKVINKGDTKAKSVDKEKNDEEAKKKEEAKRAAALEKQQKTYAAYLNADVADKDLAKSLLVSNLNGIHGIPYQFMVNADRRIESTQFGRKYADKIIAKMPLLLLTPGSVKFMSEFKEKDRESILTKLLTQDDSTEISDIISKSGRYYTFAFDYVDYYQYVNTMLRTGAVFLEIDDLVANIGGYEKDLRSFDWSKAVNPAFQSYISQKEFIAFYVDGVNQVSETFSNESTQSQLASKMDELSDLGREIAFLSGATFGQKPSWFDENMMNQTMQSIKSISDKYLNGNQLFEDIANNFATVATGGKLLFPEIWSESTYSKDYDISIKLRTPDGDKLSWYMNIYVPLCHLVSLTAPRQFSNNGYRSPFLVRAFYKGLFNTDMGLVTSLSVQKGKEGAWTIDGLPTEVDVTMTIKDLYGVLMIDSGENTNWFMNNTCLMDYIATSCGININKPDLSRTLDIYMMLKTNKIKDIPNKTFSKIQQGIDNKLLKLYNGFPNLLPG